MGLPLSEQMNINKKPARRPQWNVSPVHPFPASALGSHPCVALSSGQAHEPYHKPEIHEKEVVDNSKFRGIQTQNQKASEQKISTHQSARSGSHQAAITGSIEAAIDNVRW